MTILQTKAHRKVLKIKHSRANRRGGTPEVARLRPLALTTQLVAMPPPMLGRCTHIVDEPSTGEVETSAVD